QDVLLQMNGVLRTNTEMTESLGINLNDGRTIGERFVQVIELLNDKFDDTAERSHAASQLFGEEGVRQVNALTAAVGDLGAAIEEQPAMVDEDDVVKAREYKERVAELKTEFSQLAVTVGDDVVPVLTTVADL